MGITPVNKTVAAASELFRTLVAPILLFLLSICLIVHDSILDPPTQAQGESGLALVLIAISTGLGLDLLNMRGDK